MEVGLHFIGYILAFFFAFLYFPYLAFKTGAEYTVDLGRRRDSGEIAQFFAAVIPSSILNLLTVFWAWFGRAVGACRWDASLDYSVVAATISERKEEIQKFIVDGTRRPLLLTYLAVLMIVSLLSGLCYGYAFKRVTERPLLRDRIPLRDGSYKGLRKLLHVIVWIFRIVLWLMLETVALFSYFLWHPLFHEEVIALFPWSVQKPWLFVRMHNDRLYYGCFVRYDKSSTGDIESITIGEVRRYCYNEVDKCLADGRLPLSSFQGNLRINTNEIADIHNVPKDHFVHIQERYRREMIRRLARELLTAFAGRKQIRVDDIYVEHAGVNELSRHRYRLALRKLEELKFIRIYPPTLGLEGANVPDDAALVDFPPRVPSVLKTSWPIPGDDLLPSGISPQP
ncbi:MAG TPA: hypothetical protein VJZ76_07605 [Thermoanaerobaculia bacterium]|nr:hypothetical protein [Thermoanaerobaculia bacterium]